LNSPSIADLLTRLEGAIDQQRQALAADDALALESASQALGAATTALAQTRTPLDADQIARARRLQLALIANRELLDRASATKQRALDALIGPSTTYSAGAGMSRAPSGSRVRTA
jgi:hypothetical protein